MKSLWSKLKSKQEHTSGFYLILLLDICFDVQVGGQLGGEVDGGLTFSGEHGRKEFDGFRIGKSLDRSNLTFFRLL